MTCDEERTAFLEAAGWHVARISNDLALHHIGHAALEIENALYEAGHFKEAARAAQYEAHEE
jgi:very-short-patch-repair endonuclease